jgi:hypothetical protein
MMDMRKLAIASLLAASTAIGSSLAAARVDVDVVVAPPAPRYEVVPAPRHGYTWAPGYWAWNGHKHVWHSGRWMKERHGEHWVAHSWEQRGDRWYFHDGHWERG